MAGGSAKLRRPYCALRSFSSTYSGGTVGWSLELHLRWVIVAAVLASLFGISDEYHQSFVTGTSATLVGGLVDSIAAFASSTLFWRLVVWYRRVH